MENMTVLLACVQVIGRRCPRPILVNALERLGRFEDAEKFRRELPPNSGVEDAELVAWGRKLRLMQLLIERNP